MKQRILSCLSASVVALAGNTALAQSTSYDYENTVGNTVATGMGVGLIIFWIVGMIIGLLLFILWILMLIDCIKRDFSQKTLWIILLIVLGWIGAVAYYFAVKRKNITGGPATPSQTTPPQASSEPQSPPSSPAAPTV
ncbi:MAG: PLD nuclease N-terminal domain-containing protein [Patescibacteria group bacterium]|nr:PLD nuclease N-terminal domain-containing protein [Patescibacteria group bacterium]